MNNLKYFLMFCNPPRSGHSFVASSLNAHPNVICSNQKFEFSILNNIDKNNLFDRIKSGTEVWNPQCYVTPIIKKEIKVIGDKVHTQQLLDSNQDNLNLLKSIVGVPIKWIHVVRNPFDSLATWTKISSKSNNNPTSVEYNSLLPIFKNINDKVVELKKTEDVLTINHENIVLKTKEMLEIICEFLEIEDNNDWQKSIMKVKWQKPRITRNEINWNPNMRAKAVVLTKRYPWFNGYAFGG